MNNITNIQDLQDFLTKRIQEEESSLIQESRSPKSYWITQGILIGFKEVVSKLEDLLK